MHNIAGVVISLVCPSILDRHEVHGVDHEVNKSSFLFVSNKVMN